MSPTKLKKRNEKSRNKQKPDVLMDAIKALGGDDEDYELLKNVSEAEEDTKGNKTEDPKLAKEVSKFLKGLNIPKKNATWIVEDDEEKADSSDSAEETQAEPIVEAKVEKHGKANYLFSPTPQWYSVVDAIPLDPSTTLSEATITAKSERALTLLENDTKIYSASNAHTNSTSDAKFLSRVLTSGTLSDRLSALTLMVQSSPLHNCKALESLRGMAQKKARSESLKAARAIVDWWVGGGSPERKLRYFREQPLTSSSATDIHLVVWYFEDWLKKFFFSLLQILETLSLDPLPYVRTQSMSLIYQLLVNKPEQEQNLLRLLVNKLGDSERTVASKASYHLHNVMQSHPMMKGIIVREVSSLALKGSTTVNPHLRYYSVVTFNQIVLSIKTDKDVATQLVEIYFELFKAILGSGEEEEGQKEEETKDQKGREGRRKQKEKEKLKKLKKGNTEDAKKSQDGLRTDTESKLISAILTGVNRALPFANMDSIVLDRHMDTLFRITHTATFNVSIQALVLIQHVSEAKPTVRPRYYRALYASLIDPRLSSSSKQAMYLNLLFKSIKTDPDPARVKAFVKRFLQALISGPGYEPSFICGGLFLLGELFNTTPGLRQSLSTPESPEAQQYDPRKREPEFAGAGPTCIWELVPLLSHYHPSVSLHARQLLSGVPLTANADLSLNTLSHFLDLFVYKNPKKPKPRGSSAMQPAASSNDPSSVRLIRGMNAEGLKGTVNEQDFWQKKSEDVPANQLFFHKFFSHKLEKVQTGRAAKEVEDEDEEAGSDDSDLEEKEVWNAMKRSLPVAEEELDPDIDSDPLPEEISDEDEDEEEGDEDDNESSAEGDESESGFGEEDEDLVGSDAEAPDGLLHFGEDEEEPWGGIGTTILGKRKSTNDDGPTKRKRRLKDLPTFASLEDYEALIDGAPEDNI